MRDTAASRRTVPIIMLASGILALTACGPNNAGGNASTTAEAPFSSSAPAGDGICALLTMTEAQAAFPEVKVATPYTDLEKVGIKVCDFGPKTNDRTFNVRLSKSSVDQEITTFEAGVMDPMKRSHLTRDPFGGGGKVIVSEQGKTSGALGDIGVAAIQKGPNTIVVSTSTVTGGRDAVEKRLIALVTAAASRAP